jgi:hypothetical protein
VSAGLVLSNQASVDGATHSPLMKFLKVVILPIYRPGGTPR